MRTPSNIPTLCPRFHRASELIGRRWTGAIIRVLMDGPLRFSEIAQAILDAGATWADSPREVAAAAEVLGPRIAARRRTAAAGRCPGSPRPGARCAAGARLRGVGHRTLVQGSTDMPGPMGRSAGQWSTTIFTGTRCTTFT